MSVRRSPTETDGQKAPDARSRERFQLTSTTGLAALGLDALASCAYGPEAVVTALAVAGAAGLAWTVPVTGAIVALLLVLIICYRQVIAAYPDGGGAYTVARDNLGRRAGLIAAASLVIDYVLNVAVSVAAGVAALTSAFPALLPETTLLCLGVLVLVTGVNLRGVAAGGRLFAWPALLFVVAVGIVVVVGLVRGRPLAPLPAPDVVTAPSSVGLLLVVAAFANGCSALTGIEAIANATPAFREPRVTRARRAELALGLLLGALLLGIAAQIERFSVRPTEGRTVLSLLAEGSVGRGVLYTLVQLTTVVLLALAANTSFGGLPVLMARLSADHHVPHVFGLRGDREVYRWGVLALAGLSGVLLVASRGEVNLLVPLFAIGVFVGFALCQAGMVRHWSRVELLPAGPRRARQVLAAIGAALSTIAAVVVLASKWTAGAWIVAVLLPILALAFGRVRRSYDEIGRELHVDVAVPGPHAGTGVIVVPVTSVSTLSARALSFATSFGTARGAGVVPVHVVLDEEAAQALKQRWDLWCPAHPLVLLRSGSTGIGEPLARFVRSRTEQEVVVLIAEISPERLLHRLLPNHRGAVLARALRRSTDATVARMRYPIRA